MTKEDMIAILHYQELSSEQRKNVLFHLGDPYGMEFQKYATFQRWGTLTETAIYLFEGSEFVFIPGAEVTLGFDGVIEDMDSLTRMELQKELDDFEYGMSLEEYLKENTTPVRSVRLGPMLVERNMQEICWKPVSIESPEFQQDPSLQKAFADAAASGSSQYEVVNQVRFTKTESGYQVCLYETLTYHELKKLLQVQGFSLPSLDEWEYLCGAGCRTLYPWGNSFDFTMHLHHFESMKEHHLPYTLEQPNGFGLIIGYDPYRRELIENDHFSAKGGDGGCMVCGGANAVFGYLPCTPYYLETKEEDEEDEEDELLDGDFDFIRRIIRLS